MEEYNTKVIGLKQTLESVSPNSLFPEPIKRTVNTITRSVDAPGEIKIGPEGALLQEYLEFDGLIKPMIQAYDNFLEVLLPRRIMTTVIPFPLGVIKFEDVIITPPTKQIVGTQTRVKQLPLNARQDKTTYAVSIDVTMAFYPHNKSQPVQRESWKIGDIPVMLGSKFCNLYGLNEQKLISVGECGNDPLGYFIVEGNKKVVLQHEKLRYNRPFIFQDKNKDVEPDSMEEAIAITSKKKTFSPYICRFTSLPTLDSPEFMETVIYDNKDIKFDSKKTTIVTLSYVIGTGSIVVKLQGFISDTFLNIFYVYELFGIKNPDVVKAMILHYVPDEQRSQIFTLLNKVKSDYDLKQDLIGKLKTVMKMPDEVEKKALQEQIIYYQKRFSDGLFKHIEGAVYTTDEQKYQSKLQMLSIMVARYAQFQTKNRQEDKRDSWANKRIVSAGPAMEHLFNQIWTYMIVETLIKKYLVGITVNGVFNISSAVTYLQGNFMRDTFINSFNPNTWGIRQSILKENMTDFLKDETLVAKYSQLLRISPDTSDKGKQPSAREVNPTQLGYVCPIETPEGKQCGIVKNMAVGCYVSIGRDESEILRFVNQMKMVSTTKTSIFDSAFILNGKFIGWCKGVDAEYRMKEARRSQKIGKDVLIYYEHPRMLWVYCDSGRPTRPLLIVDSETQDLVINQKNLWNAPFSELLSNGVVEYIDAMEQEFTNIAQSIWDPVFALVNEYSSAVEASKDYKKTQPISYTRKPEAYNAFNEIIKKPRYTHCELDPNSILSVAGSLIPMPEREQAPRNTYQASMAKQALTYPSTNAVNEFPTSVKSLAYPQRPIFETQMYNFMGMDKQPIGETVQVAFMTYGGWNQEDSIIINQSAIDMGRFRIVKTLTYKTIQLTGNKEFIEILQKPIKKNVPNRDSLDEDGVVRRGTFVEQGDCLIGKVKKYRDTNEVVDASVYVGVGDSGIVEQVLKTSSSESRKIVLVKIREVRLPRAGDKLASRYAQKGTIGIVLPEQDMPFVAYGPNEGMVPDIIINPHCFTGDSLIGLSNGLSRKISSFSSEGMENVWTIGDKGMVHRHSLGMESKGVKDIVQVTLFDGRKLRCTPDHKFVASVNGERVGIEASQMTGKDVFMGLECVEDIVGQDEIGWELVSNKHTFKMDTPLNREKTLAFARILGYVLTDGTVYKDKRDNVSFSCSVSVGTKVDLELILSDVELVTGKRPKTRICNGKGSVFVFNMPKMISKSIGNLEGITIGRRCTQEANWPEFILKDDCPVSVLREFVAGLFGGDGHCPALLKNKVTPIYFSGSICQEYTESLKTKMEQLCGMIRKLGVENVKISRVRDAHQKTEEYKQRPRKTCEIIIRNILQFGEKIGFRYCVQKMSKLSATMGYVRLQENVRKQMEFVNRRTSEIFEPKHELMKDCLEKARNELKEKECILNEYYSLSNLQTLGNRRKSNRSLTLKSFDYSYFPTFDQYLEQIGCLDWFNGNRKYINLQDDEFVHPYHMKVIDVRPCGQEEVFDIGVSEFHYFTTQSVCVSNCIPSRMTIGKLFEILSSKVASMRGERINATAFRNFDLEKYQDDLGRMGFERNGYEIMINGMTGHQIQTPIFMGPCYYQALRHHVQDKEQKRGKGPVKMTNRQPTAGRANNGGIRFGEMERDAIVSHGAAYCLKEKTFDHSDAYKTIFCRKCGTIANIKRVNLDQECPSCGKKEYGSVPIPYSYKVLVDELTAASLFIKLELKPQEKSLTMK